MLFDPAIGGDWRRRDADATLRPMRAAIEVKASERHEGRLRPGEIDRDIDELRAHREEAIHRGGGLRSVMLVADSAPEERERTTSGARRECEDRAKERDVEWLYVSRVRIVSSLDSSVAAA